MSGIYIKNGSKSVFHKFSPSSFLADLRLLEAKISMKTEQFVTLMTSKLKFMCTEKNIIYV